MADNDLLLFAVTRPSRADEVLGTGDELARRRGMEDSWARGIGVDPAELRGEGSGTESTCDRTTGTTSMSGTETKNGMDVTTDNTTDDSNTVTMTDDMKTDS